jgi:hypothetical protein
MRTPTRVRARGVHDAKTVGCWADIWKAGEVEIDVWMTANQAVRANSHAEIIVKHGEGTR